MCDKSCKKSATNNQWASVGENYDIGCACHSHKKTAEDNQWCSCCKNSAEDKEK